MGSAACKPALEMKELERLVEYRRKISPPGGTDAGTGANALLAHMIEQIRDQDRVVDHDDAVDGDRASWEADRLTKLEKIYRSFSKSPQHDKPLFGWGQSYDEVVNFMLPAIADKIFATATDVKSRTKLSDQLRDHYQVSTANALEVLDSYGQ